MARSQFTSSPMYLAGVLAFGLLVCAGCAPPQKGTFTAAGYKSSIYDYKVAAQETGRLLPGSWQLDNYYSRSGKALEPKSVDSYITAFELDFDGDGDYETKVKQFAYDLRFTNQVHDGVIFVRTIPVSRHLRQKKLEVLMDRYIEQIAGAGYEVVSLSSNSSILLEKRYAAAVVDRNSAKLANREAHVVTIDVANLDQFKLDPSARKERVQLVLLHTNFRFVANSDTRKGLRSFPVVMFAGYANQPRDFEAGLPDFHDFLNRISINDRAGFSLQRPTNENAAPSPSSTASQAPSSTPSPAPTSTAGLVPSSAPSPAPTSTPSPAPIGIASPAPNSSPSPAPTSTASQGHSNTPLPPIESTKAPSE